MAAGVLGQLWVNGAVEIWWGGVGFGARRFSNSMLVFAVYRVVVGACAVFLVFFALTFGYLGVSRLVHIL